MVPTIFQILWGQNFEAMMFQKFFAKMHHFIIINQKTWPPQAILVSDWPIYMQSKSMKLHVLYQ